MIPTRAHGEFHSPQPPPWIDPNVLGAKTLRHVDRDRVCVIQGGQPSLLSFLDDFERRPQPLTRWSAYVIVRPDMGGYYVYSPEQFWLAASPFLHNKGLKLKVHRYLDEFATESSPKLKDLRIKVDDTFKITVQRSIDEAVKDLFDIHEFARCEQVRPGSLPSRPAVELRGEDIAGVFIPDTGFLDRVELYELQSHAAAAERPERDRPTGDAPASAQEPAASRTTDTPRENEVLRRTPHMEVMRNEPIRPGTHFEVLIYADDRPAHPDEQSDPISIEAPPHQNEFELSVWLSATPHFAIVQPSIKSFTIKRDESRSTDVSFDVIALADVKDPSRPNIKAIFRYQDRPCGSVSRNIELAEPDGTHSAVPEPPRRTAARMAVYPSAENADLTIVISNPSRDGRTFECIVSTPLVKELSKGRPEAWRLPHTTDAIVAQHFRLFTTAGLSPAQRIANLRGAGRELFKAAPDGFKVAFWQIIDSGKPFWSISVVSDESYIPWELMVPERRKADGTIEQRAPLGVEFAVGRWTRQDNCLPPPVVRLKDSWVFAPAYPGPRPKPLAKAAAEAKFVKEQFQGLVISPADFDGFEGAMAKGGRSLIHFVCHGSSPGIGAQAIFCEDNTEFSSTALGGAKHAPKGCATSRPFVFMNACEVGRTTPALIGVGGFASTFIELGASCVVAPLWSVKDDIAHEIACAFYGDVVHDPKVPYAKVLTKIRAKAYQTAAEDTYAAYCFYGDPLARCEC